MNIGIPMADASFKRWKDFQNYKIPFSSCKPNKEWPNIALLCYNEGKKRFLYEIINHG